MDNEKSSSREHSVNGNGKTTGNMNANGVVDVHLNANRPSSPSSCSSTHSKDRGSDSLFGPFDKTHTSTLPALSEGSSGRHGKQRLSPKPLVDRPRGGAGERGGSGVDNEYELQEVVLTVGGEYLEKGKGSNEGDDLQKEISDDVGCRPWRNQDSLYSTVISNSNSMLDRSAMLDDSDEGEFVKHKFVNGRNSVPDDDIDADLIREQRHYSSSSSDHAGGILTVGPRGRKRNADHGGSLAPGPAGDRTNYSDVDGSANSIVTTVDMYEDPTTWMGRAWAWYYQNRKSQMITLFIACFSQLFCIVSLLLGLASTRRGWLQGRLMVSENPSTHYDASVGLRYVEYENFDGLTLYFDISTVSSSTESMGILVLIFGSLAIVCLLISLLFVGYGTLLFAKHPFYQMCGRLRQLLFFGHFLSIGGALLAFVPAVVFIIMFIVTFDDTNVIIIKHVAPAYIFYMLCVSAIAQLVFYILARKMLVDAESWCISRKVIRRNSKDNMKKWT